MEVNNDIIVSTKVSVILVKIRINRKLNICREKIIGEPFFMKHLNKLDLG